MKRALGITISLAGWFLISACTQKGGPLKVDSVEPPQGTTAGGDEISIVGGGFQPGKTQAEVKFGRRKAESVTIASASKIRVVTPPNDKGPVDVQVMFDDGSDLQDRERFPLRGAGGERVRPSRVLRRPAAAAAARKTRSKSRRSSAAPEQHAPRMRGGGARLSSPDVRAAGARPSGTRGGRAAGPSA